MKPNTEIHSLPKCPHGKVYCARTAGNVLLHNEDALLSLTDAGFTPREIDRMLFFRSRFPGARERMILSFPNQ